ncbi:MAG TPA: ABC transporter permease, partial [Lachnospiraceae bacterium]|nr:ABC transporter permease [Lachnospiraceae bacterium]
MDNKLFKMIIKRIGQSIIVIFIVTLLVFLLMQLVPGDPIVNFLGANATDDQIAYYTKLFGYDQPVLIQYGKWIIGLFHGEMGRSVALQKDITEIIFQRLGVTLSIVFPAFFIAVILGVVLGIVAAKHRGTPADTVISFFANIGMSMPMFWFGMILILVFALKLGILPTSGSVAL